MKKNEINTNDKSWQAANDNNSGRNEKPIHEVRQEQTDPNLTELKGIIDPNEKLEPEGTDNDFSDTL
ncbi:hypothetical protein [Flavisolibacter tropicus]|nr:hypothetical protein [Flavisolibacter tropicus]